MSRRAGYVPIPGPDGGVTETADQAQADDLAALFPEGNGRIRVTRMRADLLHSALANDLELQASADQDVLSNVYQVTQSVNAPVCPVCNCGGGIGNAATPAQHEASGCSTASSERDAWGTQVFAAGFVA